MPPLDDASDLGPVYEEAGRQQGIDPDLLRAQTQVESSDNDYAISSAGAEGRSQFIPGTAARMGLRDPYDPREAIPAQARLLRENMDRFGDPTLAVGAYHGGENMRAWGPKTDDYMQAVAAAYARRKQSRQSSDITPTNSGIAGVGDVQARAATAGFDPSKPFEVEPAQQSSGFDPAKPYTVEQTQALPMARTEAQDKGQAQTAPPPLGTPERQPFSLPTGPGRPAPAPPPRHYVAEEEAAAASKIWRATKEAWENTPTLLGSMGAKEWAERNKIGEPRLLNGVVAAFNAAVAGSAEAANQIGVGMGMPLLGRDAAAWVQTLGMTGEPHVPLGRPGIEGPIYSDQLPPGIKIGMGAERPAPEAAGIAGPAEAPPPEPPPPEPPGATQAPPEPPPTPTGPAAPQSMLDKLAEEAAARMAARARGSAQEAVPAAQPVEPVGTTRFYHGGADYAGGSRWLTPDLNYAQGYAAKTGSGVSYVDIPNDSPLLNKTFDDTGTDQTAPFASFEAPPEIAAGLKPLAPTPEEAAHAAAVEAEHAGLAEIAKAQGVKPPPTPAQLPFQPSRQPSQISRPGNVQKLETPPVIALPGPQEQTEPHQEHGAAIAFMEQFRTHLEQRKAALEAQMHDATPEQFRALDAQHTDLSHALESISTTVDQLEPEQIAQIAREMGFVGPAAPEMPGATPETPGSSAPESAAAPSGEKPDTGPPAGGQAPPTSEALFDEAQDLMKKLPNDMGKLMREGKVTPLQQQRMDRLDAIDKLLPQTGPEWQRIMAERRAASADKYAQESADRAAEQRHLLTQAGFAEGDKVRLTGTTMLPGRPPPVTNGTIRIGKSGMAYVSAEGKQYDPFGADWKKVAAPQEAPEEQPPPETAGNRQEPPARFPDGEMAESIARKIESARRGNPQGLLFSAREAADLAKSIYGGSLAEGGVSRDRLYDAVELGVNRYIQTNPERFDPRVNASLAHAVVADLEDLKNRLPTQTVRAGEKETHQQFSTPPDYSYAAAWAANLRPTDRVIEPSAGTGSLAVHAMNAKVAEVTANEISEKRQAMLSQLGVDRLTKEDARQLHNALPDEIKPSVVLMNPPFSAAPGRMGDKRVLQEGAAHVQAALDRLEPGGRLVAIVGRGMTMEAPAFRDWWKRIGKEFDVRANVGVGGKVYTKYGTNFATRLLVIDKITPSHQPVVGGEVSAIGDLIDKLQGVRDDRPGASQQMASEPAGQALAHGSQGSPRPAGALSGPTGGVGTGEPEGAPVRPPGTVPANPGIGGTTGARPPRTRGKVGGQGNEVPLQQPEPAPGGRAPEPSVGTAPSDQPGGSGDGGAGGHTRPDGSDLSVTPPAPELVKTGVVLPDEQHGGELTESVYEPYKPQRIAVEGAKPHQGALVQSAAMASVLPPKPNYNTAIPSKLIRAGALSDAQMEAIIYAGEAHSQMLEDGEKRRGFFIGDGTGVGKGREVAGIILDNWEKGTHKAIWVSEKMGLAKDAVRDWTGLGQKGDLIFPHSKVKASDTIKPSKGILFTTYDTLKSGEQVKAAEGAAFKVGAKVNVMGSPGVITGSQKKGKDTLWTVQLQGGQVVEGPKESFTQGNTAPKSRVQQVVDWVGKDYDGVIAFDEAHNMGNAVETKGKRGKKEAAAKALAGIELQDALPNARVVYVSATGATEVSNLAYANRLGLWGKGTAFPDQRSFVSKIGDGGVAAMELVARDMKALGHYVARNLSYDGVEYDRLLHPLEPTQRAAYDKIAEGWHVVLRNMMAALKETGGEGKGGSKSAVMSAFWGGHQRFFNQLITSLQMPSVFTSIDRDLAEGRQAVLQLVNTNEAGQERALSKAAAEGAEDLEELDMSPRDQLMQMVERSFPVNEYEPYIDENGNERVRLVTDSNGNPVQNKKAVAMREKLLDELGSLRVPDGPLELLMNRYGPDAVAEVTGRTQRVVSLPDPKTGQIRKVVEKRSNASNQADTDEFQAGKKRILVFSQAGGTGRSYHADNTSASANARRAHYLVQAGWRADTAVQGFGRTHRTNQASAPIFHLVTTDLEGQKRFISSIARRLGQLGALTKGERRTGDQGMFGLADNLESEEAKAGLGQFYRDVMTGSIEGVDESLLSRDMGLKLRDDDGIPLAEMPKMTQFLNRILSLKVADQNRVFQAFSKRFEDVVQHATEAGTLDTGVETFKADKITKAGERTVYTDPKSGAETKHVHFRTDHRNFPVKSRDVFEGKSGVTGYTPPAFFVRNVRSGNISAIAPSTYAPTDASGVTTHHYRQGTPLVGQYVEKDRIDDAIKKGDLEKITDRATAKRLWDERVAKIPEFSTKDLHLITGAVLPVWDRLGGSPQVYRLATDKGERFLGRVVPTKEIGPTLKRLGIESEGVKASPAEIVTRILDQGDVATLANGWKIKRSLVAGEQRMELVPGQGDSLYSYADQLKRDGVFSERIAYNTRFFLPTGKEASGVLSAITKGRPVAELGPPTGEAPPSRGAAGAPRYSDILSKIDALPTERGGRGGGETLYSFPGALFDPAVWRRTLGPLAVPAKAIVGKSREITQSIANDLSPMQGGTKRAQNFAATFANALRQIQFRFGEIDRALEHDFTPNERMKMGAALDAQSVFEQQVRDLPDDTQARADFDAGGTGLAGLTPKQRQPIEAINLLSMDTWEQMRERGMVSQSARPIPYYFPRQILLWTEEQGFTRPGWWGGAGRGLDARGINLTTAGPRRREHLTPEETEEAARAKFGNNAAILRDIRSLPARLAYSLRAVAGVDLIDKIAEIGKQVGAEQLVAHGELPREGQFFTIADHPSFRRWTGTGWQPTYIAKEFEGPLRAVLTQPPAAWYRGAMTLKSALMTSIMWSPLIHLQVEYGRAAPIMLMHPITTGTSLWKAPQLRRDPAYMDQATADGLAPLGRSAWRTDPVSIADQANVEGHNRYLRALIEYRDAVARGAGKVGGRFFEDVISHPHQTLLWDQVFNLQVGLYDSLKKEWTPKFGPEVAGTMAAHIANRYAGAVPPEHLSRLANMMANLLLFSRSFTLGNLGVMKDMFRGAPSHILARIEHMAGPEEVKSAKAALQRKAISAFVMDIGMYMAGGALLALGFQAMRGWLSDQQDSLPAAAVAAYKDWLDKTEYSLKEVGRGHPEKILGVLPQIWNEPGKQGRVYVGNDSQGQGIYLRLPFGKVGEEFIGWNLWPGDMLMNKLHPIVRPIIESIFGKDSLGRDVYRPNPETIGDRLRIAGEIAKHIGTSLGPTSTIEGVKEMFQQHVLGQQTRSDPMVSAAKVLGPASGLATISKGYPGGAAAGEMNAQSERERYDLMKALPAIREKIRTGDSQGAAEDMTALNVPAYLQRHFMRQTIQPGLSRGATKRLSNAPPDIQERVRRQLGQ